jgi:hypothetical protein
MKVKLTLIFIQINKKSGYGNGDYAKVYFTDDDELPSIFASTKSVKETLRELSLRHFEVDFEWLEKSIQDFRIVKDSKYPYTFIAEAVYIIHAPEILGVLKNGNLLSFKKIQEKQIELDSFYERAITGIGKRVFR